MNTYDLKTNGNGYNLFYEGLNTAFIVLHSGILYINTTPAQKKNFLRLLSENKLPDLFTILRQLQDHFSADHIIVISTLHSMASLLTEEEWKEYGFEYDEAGLLRFR